MAFLNRDRPLYEQYLSLFACCVAGKKTVRRAETHQGSKELTASRAETATFHSAVQLLFLVIDGGRWSLQMLVSGLPSC